MSLRNGGLPQNLEGGKAGPTISDAALGPAARTQASAATSNSSGTVRQAAGLASRVSTCPRDHFCRSTTAPRLS
jgi:hypothetical protein